MRLQRYIGKELLLSFFLILAIVTSIVAAALILQFLHKAEGLGLVALLWALPYVLPGALPITLPLSFLVSCLLVYGRFSDDNEFTAFKMGGLHPWHAVAPAVLLGAILSISTLWLNMDVLPWATLGQKAVIKDQFQQLVRALNAGDATSIPLGKSFKMSAAGRDELGGFNDVYITYRPKRDAGAAGRVDGEWLDSGPLELRARRAEMWLSEDGEMLFLRLHQAQWHQQDTTIEKREAELAMPMDNLVGESTLEEQKRAQLMTVPQLIYRIQRGTPQAEQERKWRGELWRRLALGIAPLVFGLVGAPLGLASKRGSRASAFLLGIVVALPVYYPLLRLGENLALSGTLPAPLALNLGNLGLIVAGLFLLRRVVRS